ncbi:DNA polymerase III subunit epsilon [Paenibacillus sp. FSL R7-277]|uniref:TerD family protein n=1 Tax=Paenibacillus sp. FSL R7-277 TaxID=1227352 RepID=UPI0003E1FF76|nr:TerD family protein [Paenibacillus sp. FSL R7-277]ETT65365.1 DNA polymerase III subunit epsilon [Paenibacillus sp. FSL R7-277]
MNFTAIDFETANSGRSSACALGLVQVRDGIVTAEHNWLIDPQQPFDGMNIAIHGITPSMVRGQPTFAELWPTVEPLLQGEIVIAHNAAFDMSVLRYCLDDYSLCYPGFQYLCTYLLGKKMLQDLPSHKLNVISAHFGIRLKHHDALEDARASALILLKLMEQWQQFDPLLLAGSQGYKAGTMYDGGYTPFKAAPKKAAKKPAAGKKAAAKTTSKEASTTPMPAASGLLDSVAPVVAAQDVTASVTHPATVKEPTPAALLVPELVRGQRVDIGDKLSASRLLAAVEWDAPASHLEVSQPETAAFLLRESGRCEQERELIFSGNMEDPSGSVFCSKPAAHMGHLYLQLTSLPAAITRIALAFTVAEFSGDRNPGPVWNASVSLIDSRTGVRLAVFPLSRNVMPGMSVVIGEFYRYKDKWRFAAIGELLPGGLPALCSHYGLEADSVTKAQAESAAAAEA